jgi:hypothetical protein
VQLVYPQTLVVLLLLQLQHCLWRPHHHLWLPHQQFSVDYPDAVVAVIWQAQHPAAATVQQHPACLLKCLLPVQQLLHQLRLQQCLEPAGCDFGATAGCHGKELGHL